jgi:hypothetical protein
VNRLPPEGAVQVVTRTMNSVDTAGQASCQSVEIRKYVRQLLVAQLQQASQTMPLVMSVPSAKICCTPEGSVCVSKLKSALPCNQRRAIRGSQRNRVVTLDN